MCERFVEERANTQNTKLISMTEEAATESLLAAVSGCSVFGFFFCFFYFLPPKLHNTFVVAMLVFVVFFCQCVTPERLLNLHHNVCVAVLMLQHLKYFMNSPPFT